MRENEASLFEVGGRQPGGGFLAELQASESGAPALAAAALSGRDRRRSIAGPFYRAWGALQGRVLRREHAHRVPGHASTLRHTVEIKRPPAFVFKPISSAQDTTLPAHKSQVSRRIRRGECRGRRKRATPRNAHTHGEPSPLRPRRPAVLLARLAAGTSWGGGVPRAQVVGVHHALRPRPRHVARHRGAAWCGVTRGATRLGVAPRTPRQQSARRAYGLSG